MGQLYIPGAKQIEGPWFLDLNDLEELDSIFEHVDTKLAESIERQIESHAQSYLDKKDVGTIEKARKLAVEVVGKKEKKVTLISEDEKILYDKSLKGILKDSKLIGFKPKELHLSITLSYRSLFSLKVSRRFHGELDYSVKCPHQDIEDEIKYLVENWIDKNEPSKVKQWWSSYSGLLCMFSVLCCLISVQFIVTKKKPNIKDSYRQEIGKLLAKGINQNNQNQAIELMLKYTVEFEAEKQVEVKQVNKIPLRVFIVSIFIGLFSWFSPKTTIGLGSHKGLLKFYRAYATFVLVTVPALLIVPSVIDWILSFV